MKITLEYNDEEREEAIDAICVSSYIILIDEFEMRLRACRKHRDYGHEVTKLLDELWDFWHELKADLPGTD